MKYKYLGNSGLLVSNLSFGSWVTFDHQLNDEKSYEIMVHAYKNGINFFDNAEVYAYGESERIMGKSIKRGIKEKIWEREDLVISTKIFFGTKDGPNNKGLSRKHIIEGTKNSLKRLDLDYVDLIFCHRPDPYTPIEETVRALNFVINQGWAFYWGTSEWLAEDIQKACDIADKYNLIRPIMEQPEYNLFERSNVDYDYKPLYEKYGLGLTIWSPLASGALTGKYKNGNIPEGSRLSLPNYQFLKDKTLKRAVKVDHLSPIASKLGCSLSQLAIAWCMKNKNVSTVILGATTIAQLDENLKSVEVVDKLTPELLKQIDTIIDYHYDKRTLDKSLVAMRTKYL